MSRADPNSRPQFYHHMISKMYNLGSTQTLHEKPPYAPICWNAFSSFFGQRIQLQAHALQGNCPSRTNSFLFSQYSGKPKPPAIPPRNVLSMNGLIKACT